jgi:glutamyl-tRNA reductase
MATVTFSIADDVKDAFNAAFEGRNKSAVIAELMREAIDRAQRQQRHRDAVERIVSRRYGAPAVSESQFNAARREPRS